MPRRPISFAILLIGLFSLLATVPATAAWVQLGPGLGKSLPGAVRAVAADATSSPVQGPTGPRYVLYYSKQSGGKWVWVSQGNNADLKKLHGNAKNAKRTYRYYTEPPDRVYAPIGAFATATPMNYTIVTSGTDPNTVANPVPVAEYVLYNCIGADWQEMTRNANYDTLYNLIPPMGTLLDCSEQCPGGLGHYYQICPPRPVNPAPYDYHFPPYYPNPITPTRFHRLCHCR